MAGVTASGPQAAGMGLHPRQPGPLRFTVLDSWRGLCALWVAVYHFRVISHFGDIDLFRHGHLAVEFFFVLSGFVIACAYGDRLVTLTDRARFMVRRFGRLYPLHIATLLAVIAMESMRWAISMKLGREVGGPLFTGATDPNALVPNLLLIHGWGMLREFTWNVPSWSISVEFLLCGLFLVAFGLPRRIPTLAAFTAIGALGFLYTRYGIADQAESTTAVARGVYSFFLGCLVHYAYQAWSRRGRNVAPWLEWLIVPVFLLVSSVDGTLLPPLMFAAMIFIFAFENGPVSRVLKRPGLVRLGEISYSIYLVHYLLVLAAFGGAAVLGRVVDLGAPWIDASGRFAGDVTTLVYLAVVIAASTVTYRWIEAPGRDWFNAMSRRMGKPVSVTATSG